MQLIQIKCELVDIKIKDNKSAIVLKEIVNGTHHEIIVDEAILRIKKRLLEQYNDDERNGVYLTRGMTNIDINTQGDIWDINQEDFIWYTFSKEDVLNVVNKAELSIPIDHDKVNDIAERLLNENVDFVKTKLKMEV